MALSVALQEQRKQKQEEHLRQLVDEALPLVSTPLDPLPGHHTLFPPYWLVDTKKKVKLHLDRLWAAKRVSLDTEFWTVPGPGLRDVRDVVSFQTSTGRDNRVCVWGEFVQEYAEILNDPKMEWIYHNFSADHFALRDAGVIVERHHADTMVMDWLLYCEDHVVRPHDLKRIARIELGLAIPTFGEVFSFVPPGRKKRVALDIRLVKKRQPFRLAAYATLDPWVTFQIYLKHRKSLEALPAKDVFTSMWDLYCRQERPFTEVLIRMRERGIRIDVDRLRVINKLVTHDKGKILAKFHRVAGTDPTEFKVTSNPQLGRLFFEKLRWPVIRRTKPSKKFPDGQYSLDKSVLQELADRGKKLAQVVLDFKALDSYHKFVKKLPAGAHCDTLTLKNLDDSVLPAQVFKDLKSAIKANGGKLDYYVIRSDFNQIIDTGRISSRQYKNAAGKKVGTNVQNISAREEKDPHKIRRSFVPRMGYVFVVGDWSQIELVFFAHMGRVATMLDAFRKQQDIHARTAMGIYPYIKCPIEDVKKRFPDERSNSKNVNFATIFGAREFRVGMMIGATRDEANEKGAAFLKKWFRVFPEARVFMRKQRLMAKKRGYVTTITGRRRYISAMKHPNEEVRKHAENVAGNTPIQGSAADLCKRTMNEIEFPGLLGFAGHIPHKLKKLGAHMVLQVHDEIVLETPNGTEKRAVILLRKIMESAFKLRAPVRADVHSGNTWYDAKAG